MAWLGGDGSDFYNASADIAANSEQWNSNSFGILGGPSGTRFNAGRSVDLYNGSLTPTVLESVAFTNSTTIYVNFNVQSLFGATVGFSLRDGAAAQMGFYLKPDRTFIVTTSDHAGTVLATSPVLAPPGIWFHCQVKVVINNSTGSVELRMNGNTSADWNPTGLNTRNGTAVAQCNVIRFTGNAASGAFVDDTYWFNDQGAQPNTWQGDIRAIVRFPSNDSSIQWTRDSGSTNFSRVNQLNDGDSSYVGDNVVGHVDQYGITALGTTPVNIVAVQPKLNYRMDDAGPHQVKLRLHSGTTDSDGTTKTVGATYVWTQKILTLDPDTTAAWTASGVNSVFVGPVNVL